jgi:acyl-CoA synthetase (AMP-forming)/AMP-acid ligase II
MSLYYPELRTATDTVTFHARRTPQQVAIVCEEREVSYGRLHAESNRTAHAIRAAGVASGGRVAYLGKEHEDYYDIFFACTKSEAVLVPINWRLTAAEVDHILRDSASELLFVEREFLALAEQVKPDLPTLRTIIPLDEFDEWKAGRPDTDLDPRNSPDDPVVQIYTSGTTGLPKGVVLAHRSFFAVRDTLAAHGCDWVDWHPDDVSLIAVPGFHVGGLWWAMQAFNAGVTNVAMRMFVSEDAVDLIERWKITFTCMVPAMLQMCLSEPRASREAFRSMRKITYGGSPISEPLLKQCMDVFDCEFAQFYGLTETGNTAVCLPPSDHVPGSPLMKAAGRPYPGFDAKIVDEDGRQLPPGEIGEVCLYTPARMLEYWNNPKATQSTLVDGWIHTGDAGYLDVDGYIFICDRIKDTIIVAGENVYPAEIEGALAKHPAVLEAAVIAVPDQRWGEAIHAVVVRRPDHQVTPRELRVFLGDHIASFKIPGQYEFIDRLPRNPSGKILRRELREKYWRGMDRRVN